MPNVLIIDDNLAVLQALEFYFQSEGYGIHLASDGAAGLEKAAAGPVDIVLLDIEMPRMSGLEVCRTLKDDPALRRLPVVMMTGRPTRELVTQAETSGAAIVLGKPFDLDTLRRTFAGLLDPGVGSVAVPEV